MLKNVYKWRDLSATIETTFLFTYPRFNGQDDYYCHFPGKYTFKTEKYKGYKKVIIYRQGKT